MLHMKVVSILVFFVGALVRLVVFNVIIVIVVIIIMMIYYCHETLVHHCNLQKEIIQYQPTAEEIITLM